MNNQILHTINHTNLKLTNHYLFYAIINNCVLFIWDLLGLTKYAQWSNGTTLSPGMRYRYLYGHASQYHQSQVLLSLPI